MTHPAATVRPRYDGPVRRAWARVRASGYGTALHRWFLSGRAPDELAHMPSARWPGDPQIGNALFQGRFARAGRSATAPNQPPWRLRPSDPAFNRWLSGFGWLNHFAAVGGNAAAGHARRLVRSWIDVHDEWSAEAWAPALLGRRLIVWLTHAGFLLDGADDGFRQAFLASLARQARHLARAADDAAPGPDRLTASVALALAGLSLPRGEAWLAKALDRLGRDLPWQILGDGGYITRDPEDLLNVLRDLIDLRDELAESGRDIPQAIFNAIDRAVPMARALRHGDGGLALFNGGFEGDPTLIDLVLTRSGVKARSLDDGAHIGFQRLGGRRAVAIVDAGIAPPGDLGRHAHLAPLSFEFSAGKERLVVNCGSGRDRLGDWPAVARTTAAHSTLVLDDRNAIETDAVQPSRVEVQRNQDEAGAQWLEMAHDGYRTRFGARHRRRLYLDAEGDDLRGEDSLELDAPERLAGRAVALRFHLHPGVQASLVQGGQVVLLKTASGNGWRFRCAGGELALEESIYLGQIDTIRRTEQIVLRVVIDGEAPTFKWALQRV
ncbi:MAG: heparinase II/III family protein [Alphaproteobacteria bacterium]